jgi:hypothetical protein
MLALQDFLSSATVYPKSHVLQLSLVSNYVQLVILGIQALVVASALNPSLHYLQVLKVSSVESRVKQPGINGPHFFLSSVIVKLILH